jgi:anti-anti-sigma factor
LASIQIELIESGEWLPADAMAAKILTALQQSNDVEIDLAGIDYLDAASLQILLALMFEQKKQGKALRLNQPSSSLAEWFNYAGATQCLEEAWNRYV